MSSNDVPLKIPVINFSVQPLTVEWELTRAQVRRASEEFGCFEAIFDKNIPLDGIRRAMFGTAQELFDLPLQTKLRNVSDKPFHGYIGQSPYAPLLESMGFDEANVHENVESFAKIFWPQGNPNFCETIESYSKQLAELDQTVRRMILESLGVDKKHLEDHLDSANYLLRVMKYKTTLSAGETELGLDAHTDLNFLTILHHLNQVGGLQVQNKKGEWISVKPSLDSFIVFIGDSLNAFTNGRLHPPNHRVVIMGNEARYSAGLFCVPKLGCIVRTPKELVDKQHPLMFKPYDYHQFLAFYNTDAGRKAESALKTFCDRI